VRLASMMCTTLPPPLHFALCAFGPYVPQCTLRLLKLSRQLALEKEILMALQQDNNRSPELSEYHYYRRGEKRRSFLPYCNFSFSTLCTTLLVKMKPKTRLLLFFHSYLQPTRQCPTSTLKLSAQLNSIAYPQVVTSFQIWGST